MNVSAGTSYLFNPGLYDGDPVVRAARDGLPQDFSADTPVLLPANLSDHQIILNNPLGGRPAQLAGVTSDSVAFRYTTGDPPSLNTFPEINLWPTESVIGLNDSGTFCGTYYGGKVKGQNVRDPFRYSDTLEVLSLSGTEPPVDINSSGDLITWNRYIYRDDWGGFVNLDDIVTGDLVAWNAGLPQLFGMNDRGGAVDSSEIVGQVGGFFFVLTPEPAPE